MLIDNRMLQLSVDFEKTDIHKASHDSCELIRHGGCLKDSGLSLARINGFACHQAIDTVDPKGYGMTELLR